jgi:sugar lactone lactonase YvrE
MPTCFHDRSAPFAGAAIFSAACRLFVALLLISAGLGATGAAGQTIATTASGVGYPQLLTRDGQGNLFFSSLGSDLLLHLGEIRMTGGQVQVRFFGQGLLGGANSVGVDDGGNLFVVDQSHGTLVEYQRADQFQTAKTLTGVKSPFKIALDPAGNIFVLGTTAVQELLAPDYTTVKSIGGSFMAPTAIAVDSSDNVFVADDVTDLVYEMTAADSYGALKTLAAAQFIAAEGMRADSQGNLFVADLTADHISELLAAGGYSTVKSLGSGLDRPSDVAVDASGNLFVTEREPGRLKEIVAAGGYVTVKTLATGFDYPESVVIDGVGNIVLADSQDATVDILPALSNYASVDKIVSGLPLYLPSGIAVDSAENIFFSDQPDNSIKEVLASSGYTTFRKLPIQVTAPKALTFDSVGNLYFADSGNIYEADAASGYATVKTVATGFNFYYAEPDSIAVDGSGNVFVASENGVQEIRAQDGSVQTLTTAVGSQQAMAIDGAGNLYLTAEDSDTVARIATASGAVRIDYLGSGFDTPLGLAVDGAGNVFVADSDHQAVKEILATPPSLAAAILPGSRTEQIGTPTTVFATLINGGADTLQNCWISLPPASPVYGLSLSYQATDPTTNALTGQPNTPVTLAGQGGSQSFLISIQSTPQVTNSAADLAQSIDFLCDGAQAGTVETAPVIPGVDTIDLFFADGPAPDIIALAATPTNNGIVEVPVGGDAAFAVASIDDGTGIPNVVWADTGSATLPLTATVCQTDPGDLHAPVDADLLRLPARDRTDLVRSGRVAGLCQVRELLRNALQPNLLQRGRSDQRSGRNPLRPVYRPLRLRAMKASRRSSVAGCAAWRAIEPASASSAASSPPSAPWRISRFSATRAPDGIAATLSASASTAAWNSASSTARATRPRRCASSAESTGFSARISNAFCQPTRRGRNQVPPPSGVRPDAV